VLLMVSGVLTAGPLMLFAYAVPRLRLGTVGLMQYLNPSLQFLVATLIVGEALTPWHALAFALIWAGLAVYSLDALRRSRAARA